MGKNIKLPLQYFAEGEPEQTVPTPEVKAGVTQPQAETVDIDKIAEKATAQAEKKMQAVFKSMLEQQGFDSMAINQMTEDWKAKQQTPEQIVAEKDTTIQSLMGEKEQLEKQLLLVGKGVPLDKSEQYISLANTFVKDDTSFEEGLTKALDMFPLATEKPQVIIAGVVPVESSDAQGGTDYQALLSQARQTNNTQAAVQIKAEAAEQGIILR